MVSGKPSVCPAHVANTSRHILIVGTRCYARHGNDNIFDEEFVIPYHFYCPRAETTPKDDQIQRDINAWLSPPDPSTNHNIACETYHDGTAKWFIQGTIFREWKMSGSLLWIHGKRSFSMPCMLLPALIPRFIAGSGKSILWYAILEVLSSEGN
jgi:hypothetical protein